MNTIINKENIFSNSLKHNSPYLILEAGINHEGSFYKALKLIDYAKLTGAEAVKFQYFELDDFYLPNSKGYKNLKKMYMSRENIIKLKKYADKKQITFLCTAYLEKSFHFLESQVRVKAHKISSMDNNNIDLIKYVAKFNKPLIVSTGMCPINELVKIVKLIKRYNSNLFLLHCISNYPTLPKDLNLINIKYLKKKLSVPVGFSDHSKNIFGMINSLNFNPCIIEKHFTFDKKRKGYDHNISVDKIDILFFKKYLNFFLDTEGKEFLKNIERPDHKNQKYFRKGVYYKNKIKKGNMISIKNILKVRPGKNYQQLNFFGKGKLYKLIRNVKKFDMMKLKDIK